jgi:hypothetical protein
VAGPTDVLGQGFAWLEQQRIRFLTRPVLYRRLSSGGPALEVSAAATVGTTVFRLDIGPGITERIEARDYLIAAADLALLPGFSQPQRGDRVIEDGGPLAVATVRYHYEVIAPGREPVWRWSDPNRRCYRIHTKLVLTEPL